MARHHESALDSEQAMDTIEQVVVSEQVSYARSMQSDDGLTRAWTGHVPRTDHTSKVNLISFHVTRPWAILQSMKRA